MVAVLDKDTLDDKITVVCMDPQEYAVEEGGRVGMDRTGPFLLDSRYLSALGLIKGRSQSLCQFDRLIVRPEMKIEEMRRIVEHMTMQCGDFDAMLA